MEKMNLFLIVYATLAFSTIFVLSLLGEDGLDVYVALFAIEFFIASELASPFSAPQYRRKTIAEMVMLLIFAGIVVERIIQILG
jgi:hypothetical protein